MVSVPDPTPITVHRASFVVPVTSPPIEDGAVAVGDGRILAVGSFADVRAAQPDATVVEWSGVMTPGLVNAHTHLQYTSFEAVGNTNHADYTAWAVAFVAEYAARRNDDWLLTAVAGLNQMLAAGITCIADIVTDYEVRDLLYHRGIPGVAYLELIGTDEEAWLEREGQRLRDAVATAPTSGVSSVGISPHAPYSLEMPVLRAMGELARELGVRIHIHVAESDGEDEYYRTATGSLADRLRIVSNRRVAILEQGGIGMGAAELVESLGLTGRDAHIAHGVYLGQDGRAIMARTGTVVALCPRSNLVVGIDPPPVADFLRERVPFAVGTDGLSSSPSLDVLEDLALLRRLAVGEHDRLDRSDPEPEPYLADDLDARLVHAVTMGGATALGLADQLGSIEPGKRADLAVFDVAPDGRSPERALVEDGAGACQATMLAGATIFSERG